MKTLIRSTVITAIVLGVSACAAPVDSYCLNYIPIEYSQISDSAETRKQIKENNAVWTALCDKQGRP
jgi:hypothetical protein